MPTGTTGHRPGSRKVIMGPVPGSASVSAIRFIPDRQWRNANDRIDGRWQYQICFSSPGEQLRRFLKGLSDCDTAPGLRFFLVRNEEVGGSSPLSSTRFLS